MLKFSICSSLGVQGGAIGRFIKPIVYANGETKISTLSSLHVAATLVPHPARLQLRGCQVVNPL